MPRAKTILDTQGRYDTAPFLGGATVLLIAAATMSALSFSRHTGIGLVGCGAGSPCAEAAASPWGRIPLLDWPVSHVGAAYFFSLFGAWVVARGRPTTALRLVTRIGVLASLFFVWVMITQRLACTYCLVAHAANLAFALLVELRPLAARSWRPVSFAVGAFACITALLALAEWRLRGQAAARAEQLLAASTGEIARASHAASAPADAAGAPTNAVPERGFTGRYRLGPAQAPIRIVVISDYQCRDCRLLEQQLRPLLAARSDISFSAKHFPFCSDCNPHVDRTLHTNACWAARAAEAAGMLGGAEGFFRMHHWLFDRGGSFTSADLAAALPSLGFEQRAFVAAMESAETLERIRVDANEAIALGLHFTPMIFINGVELRGWSAPNAVARAVEAIAAAKPPPRGPQHDRPAGAIEKVLADWRAQPIVTLPPDSAPHTLGPAGAPIDVVIFGDYQEAGTAELDRRIRTEVARRGNLRYTYRNYPLSQECNPSLEQTLRPLSCLAARAAEAAALVGGKDGTPAADGTLSRAARDAFWRMHAWLLENQQSLSEETLRRAAAEQGLEQAAFLSRLHSEEVQAAVREDAQAGGAMNLKSIPTLYLNGRLVPRWELPSGNVLAGLLDAAASGAANP